VIEVGKAAAKPQDGRKRKVYREIDPSTRQRHINRHLAELERDNYHDVKIDVPKGDNTQRGPPHKMTAAVKRLLASKKTFAVLLDEAGPSSGYHTGGAAASKYPSRKFCSICGYWGSYACDKCGELYCEISCREVHLETRCLKYMV